jgi:hypothetical protein
MQVDVLEPLEDEEEKAGVVELPNGVRKPLLYPLTYGGVGRG